ncbi:MAG: DNA topoisomerase 4 subunit A [Clostridia bacterium]|nr:DNA topoisomerase 4 subunit A [Clostridia bacterium]
MARKDDKSKVFQTQIPAGKIHVQSMEEVLPSSMLPYAEFVILDRALPRVEDGLKPVQRRILYTMIEMGLTPDKPHKKSARIVGDCMGKYHPHGDSSVYDAMVRMAQPFNMRMTLVDGHGNFGSVDGDPAAAMRYTEARLQPLAMELLRDLDKETVPFSLNFDDSTTEPDILPGRFPNLLVNGANGIAVGLATNIPTHNLAEVIDGCCAYIKNPKISLKDMMKIIPGPDFSTGGYIIANELQQAYETGKGKITLRAKYHLEPGDYGKTQIVITELPYQTNKAELLKKIMNLREDKKDLLSGIVDIVDESDRTGMRAVITCRKDADIDAIEKALLKYTDLECSFGINMVAIAGGKPKQMGLLEIISFYVSYQRQVILRRTKFDLKQAQERCLILEGLIIGVNNVDEVVHVIKTSQSTAEARTRLQERFSLLERQAQAILDLRLARLVKLEVSKLEEEHADLVQKIAEYQAIIADKTRQWDIVREELQEIKKKYPCPRRTIIKDKPEDLKSVTEGTKDWTVGITANRTLKFMDRDDFTSNAKKKLGNNATASQLLLQTLDVTVDEELFIFTNLGNVCRVSLKGRDCHLFRSAGEKLPQLADGVAKNEYPVRIMSMKGKKPTDGLLFFTKDGMVKRSPWSEYDVKKPIFPALKVNPGSEVLAVEDYDPDEYSCMLFVTKKGLCLNANKDTVPVQGRMSAGVKGINLNPGDEVVFAGQQNGEGEIIIVTTMSTFKRVIASQFDPQSRATKGMMIADIKGKGDILFAGYVTVPYSLAVATPQGILELDTEVIKIDTRVSRGKPVQGISDVSAVYALYYRTDFPGGAQQLSF